MAEEIIRKKCWGCGKEIFLIAAPKGKRIPCDPELIPFWWSPVGSEIFITQDGEEVTGDRQGAPDDMTDVGYIPHWKTCRWKEQYRR